MKKNRYNQTFNQWAISLTEYHDSETIKTWGKMLYDWFSQNYDVALAAERLDNYVVS